MKLPNEWRVNWTSTATRGATSCWMPAVHSLSLGRAPKPLVIDESYAAATLRLPSGALSNPHVSPPGTVWAFGLLRSQSGLKFPLVSVQVRVAWLTDVFTRLFKVAMF